MSARTTAAPVAATGIAAPVFAAHLAAWRRYHAWSLFRPLQLVPLEPSELGSAQDHARRRLLLADDQACEVLAALPGEIRAACGGKPAPGAVLAHVQAMGKVWAAARAASDLVRHLQAAELHHHRAIAWGTKPTGSQGAASPALPMTARAYTQGQEQARHGYLRADQRVDEMLSALPGQLVAAWGTREAVPRSVWAHVDTLAARRSEATKAADLVRYLQIAELEFHRPLTWPADEWRSPLQIDGGREPALSA